MSIVYDSKIVVSRYDHLHRRLVCYKGVGRGGVGVAVTEQPDEDQEGAGRGM